MKILVNRLFLVKSVSVKFWPSLFTVQEFSMNYRKLYKYLYFIKFYRNIVFKKHGVETAFNLIQSTQSATWSDPLPSVHISTAAVGDLFLSESLTER